MWGYVGAHIAPKRSKLATSCPNDGSSPTLTPGPVGSMTVSVNWDDWTGSAMFNVTKGAAVDIIIEHDSMVVSSDDLVDLCARYTDQRGNTWGVETTWSTFGGLANDALSSFNGECIVFDRGEFCNNIAKELFTRDLRKSFNHPDATGHSRFANTT